jgi:intein-encoded DNA endonuclease-like protein
MYKNIKDIEEFKKDYYNLSKQDLIKKYNLNEKTIYRYIKKLNIPLKDTRKYSINDSFFDTDSSEKYYILGLIYTDGNLPKKSKNSFIISSVDYEILYKIKNVLNYTGKIYEEKHNLYEKTIFKLNISSKKIRLFLENFGLHSDKTFSIKFPEIPEIYLKDFVRGLWDGDGSCTLIKRNYGYSAISSFVSANYSFMEDLVLKVFKNRINILKRKNLYIIQLRKKESLILKEFMYDNTELYINRKKDNFFKITKTLRDYNALS